jgi:aryl-alcohol dehydrogenase-like predicted oxidoreductase
MTTLPTRPLGKTGMDISRVGFGTWATGGGGWAYSWGPQEDEESVAAIRHAIEAGVNWIDTAAIYGLGHSEEVVAEAVRGLPPADRPFLFTKCGRRWDPDDPYKPARSVGAPECLREEVDASLRRLGTDVIDLYQMHWPADDGTPLEAYWSTLLELKDEGKIRAAGLCNHSVSQLEAAERLGHVDTLQPPFSAIRRTAAEEIAWCRAHWTGVIVYSPMQAGLLTGAFSTERLANLHPDDWRRRSPEFQGERLSRNLALAGALQQIAEQRGTTVAAVAVAWALAWPGVTGAIVGARSPAQVDGWLPAADLELTGAELDRIAAAIGWTGAGEGPARPPVP